MDMQCIVLLGNILHFSLPELMQSDDMFILYNRIWNLYTHTLSSAQGSNCDLLWLIAWVKRQLLCQGGMQGCLFVIYKKGSWHITRMHLSFFVALILIICFICGLLVANSIVKDYVKFDTSNDCCKDIFLQADLRTMYGFFHLLLHKW